MTKIILIELDLQCSMVTHQSVLTFILDFFLLYKVVTMWQINSTIYKLKPRSFHKSAHFQVYRVNLEIYKVYNCHVVITSEK